MAIEDLLSIISPPTEPLDNSGDWTCAEIVAATEFPPDFKELIAHYGLGEFFRGYLSVFNPLTVAGLACVVTHENELRGRQGGLYSCPIPIHPEQPGLFPWGSDENGNRYCWLTKGKPAKWSVVFLGHGFENEPVIVQKNITAVLAAYATDRIKELARKEDPFTKEQQIFTSGRNQAEVSRKLLSSK